MPRGETKIVLLIAALMYAAQECSQSTTPNEGLHFLGEDPRAGPSNGHRRRQPEAATYQDLAYQLLSPSARRVHSSGHGAERSVIHPEPSFL